MGIIGFSNMIRHGINHIIKNTFSIKDGQANQYAILQTAHRLEKGLCIRDPRAGWGYDKAEKLVELLAKECKISDNDRKAVEIGKAVLAAYIEAKNEIPDEADRLSKLKAAIVSAGLNADADAAYGGTLLLHKEDVLQDASVERLFFTRHSIRDFADSQVDPQKLERAITLALRAPSACNRQASQVYVISGEARVKAGSGNEYHADKYLIITGNMRAFDISELNDWIVSTSVFGGYLSLALHAEGIGSCIFRKDIIRKSSYNDRIKALCHIPDDEQIILEMAIGNYKDEFAVPVSCRREAKEIIHYLDKA